MAANHARPSSQQPSPQRAMLGTIESTDARFVWSPPLTAGATTARKRLRALAVPVVLLAAVWAGTSVWRDGFDAVVFALIVPLMLIGVFAAADRLIGVGRNLRIETVPEGLVIKRGLAKQIVPATTITELAVISKRAEDHARSRPGGWYLAVDRANDEALSIPIPVGGGSAFDRGEASALEAELRRRCGT